MCDYEKLSMVAYPFYFRNWQSIHKTNCMRSINKILMWEVLPIIVHIMLMKDYTHELYYTTDYIWSN